MIRWIYSIVLFGEFYRKIWLSEAEKNLEPKSYHNYKRMIENRFLDKFDFIPLIDIKPYMIKQIVVNAQRINTKVLEETLINLYQEIQSFVCYTPLTTYF